MKTLLFKTTTILFFIATSMIVKAQDVTRIPESEMKKKAIKFEFFSPLTGNLTLGYETYLKNFTSLEFKVGMIGAGLQPDISPKETGVFISGGPKFKLKPDYAVDGTYGTHVLRGGYIRPEITVGTFKVTREDFFTPSTDDHATFATLTINYGKQYILADSFSLDWYFGLGYGYSTEDDLSYYYKNVIGTNSFPLVLNAGFTIGVLLK